MRLAPYGVNSPNSPLHFGALGDMMLHAEKTGKQWLYNVTSNKLL